MMTLNTQAIGIQIGAKNEDPVDIILCSGETDMDLSEFEERITQALIREGVDKKRIHIQAGTSVSFSSQGDGLQEMQDNWYCFPDNMERPKMQLPLMSNGRADEELFGPSPKGIMICNQPEVGGDVVIDMDFTWWCAVHIGGFSPRIHKVSENTYEGYFVSLEAPNGVSQYMYNSFGSAVRPVLYYGTLVEGGSFDYRADAMTNAFVMERAQVVACGASIARRPLESKGYRLPLRVHCEIENNILKVWLNRGLCLETKLTELKSGTIGYGVAACNHIGLKSFSFEMDSMTPLIEAVRSPNYLNKSDRFIVDVCDVPREDFDEIEKVGELAERIQADDAYYIGWGKDTSKSSINTFLNRLQNHGVYVPTDKGQDIYTITAKYIEPIVNRRESKTGKEYLIKDKQYLFETEGA